MNRMRFSHAHCCFSDHSVLGGSDMKLFYLLDMSFVFHGEVRGGECHSCWGMRTSNVDQVFNAMKNLLGDSWLTAATSSSGGGSTWEVQSLMFEGENLRFFLIGCAWQWPCWSHCFESTHFLRVKTYDLWSGNDGACALFPFWRHHFQRIWTSSVFLVECVLELLGINNCIRSFLFSFFFLFLGCVHL
jgi:hypothetical protein